jgi:nucleoside 2-deoxyribosyltransferase
MNTELYIASPLGFSETGRFFMHEKLFPLIKNMGYGIIDPWSLTPQEEIDKVLKMPYGEEKKKNWKELNKIIGANNARGIDISRGILAILDGAEVDSGTAAEIGYATAKQKPVLAYRSDFRLAADNEGALVNLQLEYFINLNAGTIVTSLQELAVYLPKIFPL